MQRVFDILFSGLALIVLIVPLIGVMCILRVTGEGEIFYKQERIYANPKLMNSLRFSIFLEGP